MDEQPLVTIVVPTYNRSASLKGAIRTAQGQSFARIRIAVYDNASEDDTREVVQGLASIDPRIVYHRHPHNIGRVANFQFGLERVTTPYFALLADDDAQLPNFIARSVEELERHPTAEFSMGVTLYMDANGRLYEANGIDLPSGFLPAPEGLLMMARRYPTNWTGMLFKRSVWQRVGGLDPDVPIVDIDFQLRAAGLSDCVLFHEPVAVFHIHPGSTSFRLNHRLVWPGWLRLVKNISSETRIPESVRVEVAHLLNLRIQNLLFHMGKVALVHRNYDDSRTIAAILTNELQMPSRGRLLRFATAVASRSGAVRQGIAAADGIRRLVRGLTRPRSLVRNEARYAYAARYLRCE